MIDPETAVRAWLRQWQELIAMRDFEAARALFSKDTLGFGTVAVRVEGIDALANEQWQMVWTRTSDFVFLEDSLRVWMAGPLHVLAVQWVSRGQHAGSMESFARKGRATIILRAEAAGFRACHTHFSIDPSPERFLPPVKAE